MLLEWGSEIWDSCPITAKTKIKNLTFSAFPHFFAAFLQLVVIKGLINQNHDSLYLVQSIVNKKNKLSFRNNFRLLGNHWLVSKNGCSQLWHFFLGLVVKRECLYADVLLRRTNGALLFSFCPSNILIVFFDFFLNFFRKTLHLSKFSFWNAYVSEPICGTWKTFAQNCAWSSAFMGKKCCEEISNDLYEIFWIYLIISKDYMLLALKVLFWDIIELRQHA